MKATLSATYSFSFGCGNNPNVIIDSQNNLLILGGVNYNNQAFNSILKFDVNSNTWKQTNNTIPFQSPHHQTAIDTFNNNNHFVALKSNNQQQTNSKVECYIDSVDNASKARNCIDLNKVGWSNFYVDGTYCMVVIKNTNFAMLIGYNIFVIDLYFLDHLLLLDL
eukprot:329614_1